MVLVPSHTDAPTDPGQPHPPRARHHGHPPPARPGHRRRGARRPCRRAHLLHRARAAPAPGSERARGPRPGRPALRLQPDGPARGSEALGADPSGPDVLRRVGGERGRGAGPDLATEADRRRAGTDRATDSGCQEGGTMSWETTLAAGLVQGEIALAAGLAAAWALRRAPAAARHLVLTAAFAA